MMSNDEINSSEDANTLGSTRRNVLKAGIATGVGVVAWSGPSITSLGGTPAYALGCTFVQTFKGADCRNTTQQNCGADPFSYQPLDAPISGFSWTTNVGNTCCSAGGFAVLSIPAGIECKATVSIYPKSGDCTARVNATAAQSTLVSSGSLTIPLNCLGQTNVVSSTRYDVQIKCNSIGAPAKCLD